MKVIGITGGVGSGKSEVIDMLYDLCNCKLLKADDAAKSLEKKGEPCYYKLIELLGNEILDSEDNIDKQKMAAAIFAKGNEDILLQVNNIIHPEVKRYIIDDINKSRKEGNVEYYFLEAALLIEEHYDEICDELWYIYAEEKVRRARLKNSRNYSDEKINRVMESQLDEATFRKYCKNIVDNSGDIECTKEQIISILESKRV